MRADDTPDYFPDVDEQLLRDYPELAPLLLTPLVACPLDTDGDGNCPIHTSCATRTRR